MISLIHRTSSSFYEELNGVINLGDEGLDQVDIDPAKRITSHAYMTTMMMCFIRDEADPKKRGVYSLNISGPWVVHLRSTTREEKDRCVCASGFSSKDRLNSLRC